MSRRVESGLNDMNGVWNSGFDPVIDEKSEVLILGSFPSVKSREIGFYYGNPQNRFWKTLEKALRDDVPDDTVGKTAYLLRHKVALWDVFSQAKIKGSSDADITAVTGRKADVVKLLNAHPSIKTVIFNGKKAFATAAETVKGLAEIKLFTSTSPANPRFDEKQWVTSLREILKIKE